MKYKRRLGEKLIESEDVDGYQGSLRPFCRLSSSPADSARFIIPFIRFHHRKISVRSLASSTGCRRHRRGIDRFLWFLEEEQSKKELPGCLVGFNLVEAKLKTGTFRPTYFYERLSIWSRSRGINNISRFYSVISCDVVAFDVTVSLQKKEKKQTTSFRVCSSFFRRFVFWPPPCPAISIS